MATQKLYDKFHDFTIPPNSNPIEALHALEDTNRQMAEKGMGISDTSLHGHFISALPDEYGHVKATLQAMKNRDRGRHAVLHPAPEEGIAAVVSAARGSVFFE